MNAYTHEHVKITVALHERTGSNPVMREIVMRDVLYHPDMAENIISCSSLCQEGYDVKPKGDAGRAVLNGVIEFRCKIEDGVFVIQ